MPACSASGASSPSIGNDDTDRPHGLRRGDHRLHRRWRCAQLRPSVADPVPHPARLRPDVGGARPAWRLLLHRPCRAAGAVLLRPEGHQPQPARDFRQGADLELPRGGAGRPVRHRAQQHAARSVHVPRRRPACGDEPPLQRDDAAARRFRRARRQRLRHHRRLRRRRFDLRRQRQDDPRRDREHPRPRHDHHRSRS